MLHKLLEVYIVYTLKGGTLASGLIASKFWGIQMSKQC